MLTPLSRKETIRGYLYMAFQMLLLPVILRGINEFADDFFQEAELNFLYFLLNFLSIHVIFHSFLKKSLEKALQHPIYLLQAVILGLAGYFGCTWIFSLLISRFHPDFVNLNDAGIASMARDSLFLMAVGTTVLVPPVEECFFRGLIFRNLYEKNRVLAYLVSMLAFAALHLLGSFGRLSVLDLILCTIQYLPAGLCLAWAYEKTGTIYAPIVIHALVNFRGIYTMR